MTEQQQLAKPAGEPDPELGTVEPAETAEPAGTAEIAETTGSAEPAGTAETAEATESAEAAAESAKTAGTADVAGATEPVGTAGPVDTPATVGNTPESAGSAGDRRRLRAVVRWTAALAVFVSVGTATAYGITEMERTDVPGLATTSDGRWDYPTLTRPPLPSGSPAPFAASNPAGAHYADLRALLLPAPEGATEDEALRDQDGWLETKDYLAEYALPEDREDLGQNLVDYGLRHIAARGWTTPDGTRTRVYLLRFGTQAAVDKLLAGEALAFTTPVHQVRGAAEVTYDEGFPERAAVSRVQRFAYVETKPYGPEQVRFAHIGAGDVYALVVQARKGTAASVPFQQTVILQSQLLG